MTSVISGQRGFSLIEAVITIAVIAVVATAIAVSWVGYQRSQPIEAATRDLLTMLREAQGNAIARVNDSDWGVRVWNSAAGSPCDSASCAELFYGSTYASANVTRQFTIPSAADFAEPGESKYTDIIFAERLGTLAAAQGRALVSYASVNASPSGLLLAEYVGAGGNCTSNEWKCQFIERGSTGTHSSIAVDSGGYPWVSYEYYAVEDLRVAHYDPANPGGCASPDENVWSCETVDSTGLVGIYSSIAFDAEGIPWVAYLDRTNTSIKVATRGGGFGSACPGGSTPWTCGTVDNSSDFDAPLSMAIHPSTGRPWVAYRDKTNGSLRVATYVGSGGNCDSGVGSDAWNCTLVDDNGNMGYGPAIAFDASGTAWIAHTNLGGDQDLRIAKYVGSGGNCDAGAGSDAWDCTTVDALVNTAGEHKSLAIDANGNPWVTYFDEGNAALKLAWHVGTDGTCDPAQNTSWNCALIDDAGGSVAGKWTSMAFDGLGNAWVSYCRDNSTAAAPCFVNPSSGENSDLKIATTASGTAFAACPGEADPGRTWYCGIVDSMSSTRTAEVWTSFALAFGQSAKLIVVSDPSRSHTITVNTAGGIAVQ